MTLDSHAHQQSLFETEPPPWEVDDASEQLVATVVIAGGPTGEFDYLVPAGLTPTDQPERRIEPGRRVRVPLGRGNRNVVGYCVALANKPTGGRRLKSVAGVLDRQQILSPPLLRLTRVDGRILSVPLGRRCWKPWCRPACGSRQARAKSRC